jgi:hypothetical protein
MVKINHQPDWDFSLDLTPKNAKIERKKYLTFLKAHICDFTQKSGFSGV